MKTSLYLAFIPLVFAIHFVFAFLEWRRCKGRLAPELVLMSIRKISPSGMTSGLRLARMYSGRAFRHPMAFQLVGTLFRIAIILGSYYLFSAVPMRAQDPTSPYVQPPVRVEVGGFGSSVTSPYGNWYGENLQVWLRSNPMFIPAIIVESQTRPQGTQTSYAFFSYTNWTKSFYTTEGFSFAPVSGNLALYYPRNRQDVKGFLKVTGSKHLVLDAGFTRFDFGTPGRGQIYNAGTIYYHGGLVVEGNLFLNRNQPGNLVSASGALSAQYGHEGRYWLGITVSGGQQLYAFNGVAPTDISLYSYSTEGFYRKWFTRHMGYKVSFRYLRMLDAYQDVGGSTSLFFDF